jgi:hypothetical protein
VSTNVLHLAAQPLDFDDVPEPPEIFRVVGQQVGDAISQHGGDDIGVVDLLA